MPGYFDWNEANVGHIEEHGLTPEDVEDALRDPRRISVPAYRRADERRWGVVGETQSGRLLFVVLTRRGQLTRVVTARDANSEERRRYGQRRSKGRKR